MTEHQEQDELALNAGSGLTTLLQGNELSAACGYVRRSEGTKVSIEQHKDRIVLFAAKYGFLLRPPIYVDLCFGGPLERPAFRALLDIVRELHIPWVILPSMWHLSQDDEEAAEVHQRLISYDSQAVFIRD